MKVYLRTLGCRANHYDTEVVRAMVLAAGHETVGDATDADVAVFNSCTVTAAAEADLRQQIRAAARARPGLRTLVMGCATGRPEGARTIGGLPSVASVVPGADFDAIGQAIGVPVLLSGIGAGIAQTGARALLRIQDGCDEHCTFCATTLARGANRSRPAATLIEEARSLAERHAEIVLTGIHIGGYGTDIGSTLGALVERLVQSVPGARFRLSSIEATEVDARLAELLADGGTLAPHLHAPLQSGSDAVLRRMGRHWYSAATYARRVEAVVRGRAVFGLGADMIAGFPGETDADHRASLAMIADLPFTYLHVFPYSVRPGTAAERLPGQVDGGVAAERAAELRAAGASKHVTYSTARAAGGPADVVVVTEAGKREGVTGDYLVTRVPLLPSLPRGARYRGVLSMTPLGLLASPLHA